MRLSRHFTKKQRKQIAKFQTKVKEWLTQIGAIQDESKYLLLPTIAGILRISFGENEISLVSIFGRFDAPALALALAKNKGINCNHYSGKWNHHYTRDEWEQYGSDKILSFFQQDLETWLID